MIQCSRWFQIWSLIKYNYLYEILSDQPRFPVTVSSPLEVPGSFCPSPTVWQLLVDFTGSVFLTLLLVKIVCRAHCLPLPVNLGCLIFHFVQFYMLVHVLFILTLQINLRERAASFRIVHSVLSEARVLSHIPIQRYQHNNYCRLFIIFHGSSRRIGMEENTAITD